MRTLGPLVAMTRDNRVRSLGGEAFGDERCVRCRIRYIRRRRGSFFLDVSEQPHPRHVGRPLLLSMIVGETAGLEDDGAQGGDAPATGVVEVHKRKAGAGHRILPWRDPLGSVEGVGLEPPRSAQQCLGF